MKKIFGLAIAVLLALAAPAAAQVVNKPALPNVAGPTSSQKFGTIITDPFGSPSSGGRVLFAAPAAKTADTAALTTTSYTIEALGYGTLNAAIAGIGSTPTTLLIGKSYTLTGSVTVPDNVQLVFEQSGQIVKASTYTLTINGPVSAPIAQIFSGFSPGDVTFNPRFVENGYAEWWGCKSDQSVDCLASLQAAASSNLPRLTLLGGDYLISATWKINRNDFVVEGQGVLFQSSGKPVTRLLVNDGTSNVLQVGPDTNPGGINDFINNVRLSNFQVSRNAVAVPPSPGSEISAPTGVLLQFARSIYLDNLYSDASLIGYTFNGTSNVRANYLGAFISDAALDPSPAHPNFFWGYYFNGSASIGAAGGNASVYLINSFTNNAASAANLGDGSIGFGFTTLFEDVYLQQVEASRAAKCVSVEGSSGATTIGNNNLTIINPICDQSSRWGLYFHNLSDYASVTVLGGYNAPITGSPSGATAGIGIYSSGGSIHISGFQHVNQSATNIACMVIDNSTGVTSSNICTNSLNASGAIQLISAANNKITDVVNAPSGTSSGAAVYATGSSYNYIAPSVMGAAGVYTYAVNLSGAGNSANEVNLSGVKAAAISGGINNAMQINGSTITANGLSSSNLVLGYAFAGKWANDQNIVSGALIQSNSNNWNFAQQQLRRNTSNSTQTKMTSFMLDGDPNNDTNLTDYWNFILYTAANPTSGSTSGATTDFGIVGPGTLRLPRVKWTGTNSTGSTAASWGSNCPAVTCSAPYTWITVTTSDGSTGYMPIYK